ncbi:MAG: caspase family protein [Pyrinomonadaceae bacterium]
MKTIITLFALLLISLPAHPQQGRQLVQENSTTSPKRLALVIGNAAYENAPSLKNPANDAVDIAGVLSKLGFSVDHGVNLTQRRMKAMIREFGQKLKGGGQGLFYFAGHGVQLRGRNYLIPVDANIQSETDVEDQGVDTNLMLGMMDEAGNGLNVVILDACRNNPFSRSFRSASNGLAQMDAPSGTLIAYATAPGSVASDGNARNGLYTQELLKNMLMPDLSIEEVFKRVRISVRNSTAGKQTPWEASSLTGDFYFRRADETGSGPGSNIVSNRCFAGDIRASSPDRAIHYAWAKGQNVAALDGNLKDKVAVLFQCSSMDAETLSSAFGNMSVIIARYVPDANCFGGDAGVASTDWSGHKSWGLSKGVDIMRDNLQWKIGSALKCMDRSKQISFYADVSVPIAGAQPR